MALHPLGLSIRFLSSFAKQSRHERLSTKPSLPALFVWWINGSRHTNTRRTQVSSRPTSNWLDKHLLLRASRNHLMHSSLTPPFVMVWIGSLFLSLSFSSASFLLRTPPDIVPRSRDECRRVPAQFTTDSYIHPNGVQSSSCITPSHIRFARTLPLNCVFLPVRVGISVDPILRCVKLIIRPVFAFQIPVASHVRLIFWFLWRHLNLSENIFSTVFCCVCGVVFRLPTDWLLAVCVSQYCDIDSRYRVWCLMVWYVTAIGNFAFVLSGEEEASNVFCRDSFCTAQPWDIIICDTWNK